MDQIIGVISEVEHLDGELTIPKQIGGGGGSDLGPKTIVANGTYRAQDDNLDGYNRVTVNVPSGEPVLQDKSVSITPSESAQSQTVTADSGYDGLDEVTVAVGAIPDSYVGSAVPRQAMKVVTPTEVVQTAVAQGSYTTGAVMVGPIPSEYVVPSGKKTITANGTDIDVAAYALADVSVPDPTAGITQDANGYIVLPE